MHLARAVKDWKTKLLQGLETDDGIASHVAVPLIATLWEHEFQSAKQCYGKRRTKLLVMSARETASAWAWQTTRSGCLPHMESIKVRHDRMKSCWSHVFPLSTSVNCKSDTAPRPQARRWSSASYLWQSPEGGGDKENVSLKNVSIFPLIPNWCEGLVEQWIPLTCRFLARPEFVRLAGCLPVNSLRYHFVG